jgi:hypothetical protein
MPSHSIWPKAATLPVMGKKTPILIGSAALAGKFCKNPKAKSKMIWSALFIFPRPSNRMEDNSSQKPSRKSIFS